MKQIKENVGWGGGDKLNHPWAFVLCAPICQVTAHVYAGYIIVLLPAQAARRHIRHLWGRRRKSKSYVSECTTMFGRVLKPTIYIYTDIHIFLSVLLAYLV